MTIQTERYTRIDAIRAVRVTEENATGVAQWLARGTGRSWSVHYHGTNSPVLCTQGDGSQIIADGLLLIDANGRTYPASEWTPEDREEEG